VEYANSRDNNFKLIRLLAALLVLFSHSFPVSLGIGNKDPLYSLTGITLGTIAVDIFFFTSGFLVASSLCNRKNIVAFFWARFIRIYPGLIVSVLFCTFVVGTIFTSHKLDQYISDSHLFNFIIKNSIMLGKGVVYELPGVFQKNIYPNTVNGSLWTLPWEIRMYVLLGLIAIVARSYISRFVFIIFAAAILVCLSDILVSYIGSKLIIVSTRFLSIFFYGALIFIYRHKVTVCSKYVGFQFLIIVVLFSWEQKTVAHVLYILFMPYIVLFLAYNGLRWIRGYNRFGDYSYGLYIYAFPVQQCISALGVTKTPYTLFLVAVPITLFLSILSWHYVEKPCLRLKNAGNIFNGLGLALKRKIGRNQ